MVGEVDEEVSFRSQWGSVIERESAAREGLAAVANSTSSAREKRTAARKWWATVEEALRLYARALAYPHRRAWVEAEPVLLIWALHGIAGYLAVGNIEGPVAAAIGRGSPGAGPTERLAIGWASAYIRLCRDGTITDDPAPIDTVMRVYGVERTTAQGWARRQLPDDVIQALAHPEAVQFKFSQAGPTYRRRGRSHKAVSSRASKRGDEEMAK